MRPREIFLRVALGALSAQLLVERRPTYREAAWITTLVGLVGNTTMRRVSAAAVQALGKTPTQAAVWRFAWDWWYQRATGEVLAYQADRLTPEWIAQHVEQRGQLPPAGCILLSIHHFNQLLGFARLSAAVDELGAASMFDPLPIHESSRDGTALMLDAAERRRTLSRFTHRVFGPRVYLPAGAARGGLELLRRGGYLVVLADFYGKEMSCLFGKSIPVAEGPVWWAEHSGRPIVPFLVTPPVGPHRPWTLWCGEPIAPTRAAVVATVEECIRIAPAAWMSWRGWHASPDCATGD